MNYKQSFRVSASALAVVHCPFFQLCRHHRRGARQSQADTLRKIKTDSLAKLVVNDKIETSPASKLRAGNILVAAAAGDLIPGDGQVIEGIANIDECVITGESARVIRIGR